MNSSGILNDNTVRQKRIFAKRILMITPVLDSQDAFRGFVPAWINTLSERFESVVVITAYAQDFTPPSNVTVYPVLKKRTENRFLQRIAIAIGTWKHLWIEKVDVVFVHMNPLFVLFAAPIAKLRRIPIILWYAHRGVYKRLRMAHWFADNVATASEESFRVASKKRVILGHGIDTTVFTPEPRHESPHETQILSVSRIAHTKRCDIIIDAFSHLRKMDPQHPARLVFVGGIGCPADRVYFGELQKQVCRLGLSDSVEFKGKVSYEELAPYYQSCDLFINASDTGSVDKAVLEAMACERLVLSCNEAFDRILTPILPELYLRERNALALAARMQYLMDLPQREKEIVGKQLRETVVQNHSLQELPDKIASLLEKIDGKNNR